jgi:hypothetical protein
MLHVLGVIALARGNCRITFKCSNETTKLHPSTAVLRFYVV